MTIKLNRKKILSSFCIIIICVLGDKNSAPQKEVDLAAAICDNVTHGILGLVTWFSVTNRKTSSGGLNYYLEVLLCGLLSSLIDFDHFISAKSLNLKDATSLTKRPFLHCTSIVLVVCSCVVTFSSMYDLAWLYNLGWILITAFVSHHIRDSVRRGFWLWPFGSTKPTPYALYVIAEALLPHAIAIIMYSPESSRTYDSSDIVPV